MAVQTKPKKVMTREIKHRISSTLNAPLFFERNVELSENIFEALYLGHGVFLIDEEDMSFRLFCELVDGEIVDYGDSKRFQNQKIAEISLSFSSDNLSERKSEAIKKMINSVWGAKKHEKTVADLFLIARELESEHGGCFPIAGVNKEFLTRDPQLTVIKNFY
ncbi:MAG: hypothetical protein AAF443_00150 [Chlamydiota bacterium]